LLAISVRHMRNLIARGDVRVVRLGRARNRKHVDRDPPSRITSRDGR